MTNNIYGVLFCNTPNCSHRKDREVSHSCFKCGVLLCAECAILHLDNCLEVKKLVRA